MLVASEKYFSVSVSFSVFSQKNCKCHSGQSALSASKFSYLSLNKGYEFGQTLVTREFLDINLMYGVMPVMHLEYSSMNLHPVATTVTIPIV